jgi:hypothetical protein
MFPPVSTRFTGYTVCPADTRNISWKLTQINRINFRGDWDKSCLFLRILNSDSFVEINLTTIDICEINQFTFQVNLLECNRIISTNGASRGIGGKSDVCVSLDF